jgi:hypothetical protein
MYVYGWFFDFVPTSGSGQFRVYKKNFRIKLALGLGF